MKSTTIGDTIRRVAWTAALVLAVACARPPMTERNARYLALGDSYTIGEAVPTEGSFPHQLVARLERSGLMVGAPLVIARTGWTTDELSNAIDAADPQGPFELVTLLIGVNNQYRGRPVDEYAQQFSSLLERAIAFAGGDATRVVVVSIPDWGVTPFAAAEGRDSATVSADIDAFNTNARSATEASGGTFVDITPISRQARNDVSLLASDQLHPSARMYTLWTEEILPAAARIVGRSTSAERTGAPRAH